MHKKLHISRYNKTRNWAVWANEELLAVTVYRKGAQAVLDYIHTLTQNTIETNTMSKTKSTAAATTTSTEFDPTIIKAVNGEGKTIRIKFDPLGVSVCYNLKGKWSAHEIYNQPLPELIAEGVFTIEDEDSQKTYAKYFNAGKKDKRSKAKRSKAKKQKKSEAVVEVEQDEQPTATIEEAPQIEAAEEAAAAEINEEVEAALWQEIEEAREAEQLAEVTMEAEEAEEAREAELAEESNEPVTDVEPTAEAPAQESAAEAAEPAAAKPALHKTCNVILNGELEAHAIPEGYVPAAGDLLRRNYKGEVVEVFVVAKGQYEWNGEVYPTLTHISWKVAGYQISGNTFFGLPIKPRKG